MQIPNLADLEGFEWDDANKEKVTKRMAIQTAEAAFLGEPAIYFDQAHSEGEPRWFLMNRVGTRDLFLAFTIRGDKIRVISARFMHKKEVKKYGKKIG